LSELLENTIEDLEKAKCISVEEELELVPANLGRIASFYYIKYMTLEIFSQSLNESRKLRSLLEILCTAHEFESVFKLTSTQLIFC
jgi:pre-mRNA-splicing helicase BRR2